MTSEEKMKVAELIASCTNTFSAKLIAEMYGLRTPTIQHDQSIEQFITTTNPEITGRVTSDLYQDYTNFCKENSLAPRYITQFVNYITTTTGLVVRSVKGARTFVESVSKPSNIINFLTDTPERLINGHPNISVYNQYEYYCKEHDCQPISKIEFGRQLCRIGGYQLIDKKVAGIKRRVYIKMELNT